MIERLSRAARVALAPVCLVAGAWGCSDAVEGTDPSRETVGPLASARLPATGRPFVPPDGQRFQDVTEAWGFGHVKRLGQGDARDLIAASVCPLDVDGRAPLDLFFPLRTVGEQSSRLYVGSRSSGWTDETRARGLDVAGDALGCLAFDADGDRDQDLLVVGVGLVQLFENRGGTFLDVSDTIDFVPGPRHIYISSAAGDFDGDGDVDVAIGGYVDLDPSHWPAGGVCRPGIPCDTDPSWSEDLPNPLLLRGDDGRWRNRAEALMGGRTGLAAPKPTLAMAAMDVDLDGVVEILVGNDFRTRDQVLRRGQGGGLYEDVAAALQIGISYRGFSLDSMGWTTGDVNGDFVEDHVITGFEGESSAVHLSSESFFFEDAAPDLGLYTRRRSFRWGAALVDLDLDGDVDLVEATGHFYREEHLEPGGYDGPVRQPTNLFDNVDGDLVPVETGPEDPMSSPSDSRGLAIVDLDDDGRPDVVLADAEGRPHVLRNTMAPRGHWLRVVLRGPAPNTEAVGARVELWSEETGERVAVRHKKVGEGYGGNFDPRLLFGMPDGSPVRVVVFWPDGAVTEHPATGVDREIVVER